MSDFREKFTLDQLLKAKRQEKPDSTFWNGFDRELKSKQRLLIQSQLVKETRRSSASPRRIYLFGSLTTVSFAAFAVFIGLRTPSDEILPALQGELATAQPSFTVATTQAQSAGLREFSTLAHISAPRMIVRSSELTAQSVAVPVIASVQAQNGTSTLASIEDFNFDFVDTVGLFDIPGMEMASQAETVASMSRYEQAFALGKYADPLDNDFTRSFDPVHSAQPTTSGRLQNASFSELDRMFSRQGRRSNRSLDALSVKF